MDIYQRLYGSNMSLEQSYAEYLAVFNKCPHGDYDEELNKKIFSSYAQLIARENISPAKIQNFIQERDYLLQVSSKEDASNLQKQPMSYLIYYLCNKQLTKMIYSWPYSFNELLPFFKELDPNC